MNLFFTQLRRRAVLFGLLAILLAAVVAFQAIGFSSLIAVRDQINAVSGRYTTIAVPRFDTVWVSVLSEGDGAEEVSLLRQKTKYPGLLSEDRRVPLAAHVTGCAPVSAYERGYSGEAADAFDAYAKSMSVYAVRCVSACNQEWENLNVIFGEDGEPTGETEPYLQRWIDAEFTLESVICQFPDYETALPPIETVSFGTALYPHDGKLPFEEGKTYLLFGCAKPTNKNTRIGLDENNMPIFDFDDPGNRFIDAGNQDAFISEDPGLTGPGHTFLHSWQRVVTDEGWYRQLDEDSLPYYAEYTGSVEDFLAGDGGTVWREKIIPMCQTNYESAKVILTDNLESLLWFNTGDASIFEGRSFEPSDYANGEDVCLVSAAYALKNGLSVGDSIEMDFYKSALTTRTIAEGEIGVSQAQANIYEPCKEENRLGIKKNYKIVGIYSAPEFKSGETSFYADTIFAPKTSVPGAEAYEQINNRLLYSLILENGKAGEFEAAMKERDCGGVFAYFDQDYNALAGTLDVMEENAVRMVLISGALFVLVAALFFFLFLRQTADPAKKLRLLGVRAGNVRRQRYGAAVVLIVVAAVLGAAGGAGLYGAVTKRVLSGNIALQPTALLFAVAAQMVLLLLAALLCTLATAQQNLMQKK